MGFDPMCVTTKRVLKKLGGDKISGEVFTFDGNPEGKPKEGLYVKISDKRPDWSTLIKVKGVMYGQSAELTVSDLKVIDSGVGTYFTYQDIPIVMIVYLENDGGIISDLPLGLHVLCDPDTNSYVSYVEFAETIVPIDPKYLPNKVVDFDQLGLTAPILELFNTGGGDAQLGTSESDGLAIINKFPLNGEYIAKLTIPGAGVYYVKPVYTMVTDGWFHSAHFDAYIMQNSQLVKFYVQVFRPGEYYRDFASVKVGFYT